MPPSNDFYASSPSVIVPTQPIQYFDTLHHNGAYAVNFGDASNPLTPDGSIPPTPGSLAGRKRARADDLAPEDDESELEDGSTHVPANVQSQRVPPVDGLGTTLAHPTNSSYVAASQSHFGPWVEERRQQQQVRPSHAKRPSITSRKSQRVDSTVTPCSDDLAQLVLPFQLRETSKEPLIDEATRVLGISWTRMDSSEALRINRAAYSKWIQRHYSSLQDVVIWLENSSQCLYLVVARNAYSGQQEYLLFSHDLTEARRVTNESSQLLPRLKMLPALHLAAPGGCLYAETDPVPVCHDAHSGVQLQAVGGAVTTPTSDEGDQLGDRQNGRSVEGRETSGMCSAHAMELD